MNTLQIELATQDYTIKRRKFGFRARYDDGKAITINSYRTIDEIAHEIREHVLLKDPERNFAVFSWEGDREERFKQPGRVTKRPTVEERTRLLYLLLNPEEIVIQKEKLD